MLVTRLTLLAAAEMAQPVQLAQAGGEAGAAAPDVMEDCLVR